MMEQVRDCSALSKTRLNPSEMPTGGCGTRAGPSCGSQYCGTRAGPSSGAIRHSSRKTSYEEDAPEIGFSRFRHFECEVSSAQVLSAQVRIDPTRSGVAIESLLMIRSEGMLGHPRYEPGGVRGDCDSMTVVINGHPDCRLRFEIGIGVEGNDKVPGVARESGRSSNRRTA
jgi:hypothetical protein